MASLLDQINAAKKDVPLPEKPSIILRGTGITKRLVESDSKAYERDAAKSLKADAAGEETEQRFSAAVEATMAAIVEASKRKDLELDESQVEALTGLLHNMYAILIGGAGTGKTTLLGMFLDQLKLILKKIDIRTASYSTVEIAPGMKERVRDDQTGPAKDTDYVPSVAIATFTGRGAQQCKRAIDPEWHRHVSTIHSLLGYAPTEEDVEETDALYGTKSIRARRVFRPTFTAENQLPYNVIIIDEASMVPIPLWNELIAALKPGTRIYLIGDINQLPPVMGKSVLGFAMKKWPVFELRHIHRQAAGNPIIANAHRILNGALPMEDKTGHVTMIGGSQCPGGSSGMKGFVVRGIKTLADAGLYDPLRDYIIVPQNITEFGTQALNSMFVTLFNEERTENGIVVNKRIRISTGTEQVYYAVGDKIMMTANINSISPPITNGMMGVAESIAINGKHDTAKSGVSYDEEVILQDDLNQDDMLKMDALEENLAGLAGMLGEEKKEEESRDQRQASHVMTIRFETGQRYIASTAGDFSKIDFGYVMTCHKAQGGEAPNVIIIVHSAHQRSLSREWLYTAFTRARQNVYLIYNDRGLGIAVGRQVIKGRTTAEKVKSFIMQTVIEGVDGTMLEHVDRNKFPVIFKPVEID